MLMWPQIFRSMPPNFETHVEPSIFLHELEEHENDLGELPGWLFKGLVLYIEAGYGFKANGVIEGSGQKSAQPEELELLLAGNISRFAGAEVTADLSDERITHVVVGQDRSQLKPIRETLSR